MNQTPNNKSSAMPVNSTAKRGTYLLVEEKEKLFKLILCVKMICHRAVEKVGYAWGCSRFTVMRIVKSAGSEKG